MTQTTIAFKTTFAEHMDQVLYGPGGYYASGQARSGRGGDYFTAPDTGPVFGRLLAETFKDWQAKLGITPFHLVEAGPGEGALARSIRAAAPDFPYTAIERSPFRREKLAGLGPVFGDLQDLPPFSGCLFANELLDAFPVHQIRIKNGKLEESYVDSSPLPQGEGRSHRNGGAVRLLWDVPSTPHLQAYLDRINIQLPEAYQTEINLAMAGWFKTVSQKLERGLVLLIDYGRPAHEYYAPERDRGTLRSFRKHRVGDAFLAEPGLTDLTADVDFTSAALDARATGVEPLAFMELGSFLMTGAARLREAPRGLQFLIHPDGLGAAFHVLILGKNVPLTEKDFPHNRLKRLGL